MYITIILCRNYLQIVRSNYVYFGQINESVCLSVCLVIKSLKISFLFGLLSFLIQDALLQYCPIVADLAMFALWTDTEHDI